MNAQSERSQCVSSGYIVGKPLREVKKRFERRWKRMNVEIVEKLCVEVSNGTLNYLKKLCLQQVKQTRDKIKQYQKKIEQNLEKERLLAKELLKNGKKDRALLLLRKKKYQEQILSRADGQLENLERMVHDLEFAQVEVKVVDGLKVGNTTLKQLHALLSIDEIEKVMDETREGIEKQREIDEILTSTVATEEQIDESEIEAELDALIEADINEKVPEIPKDVLLPDVPKESSVEEEEEEEEEKEKEKEKEKKRTKEKIQEPIAVMA